MKTLKDIKTSTGGRKSKISLPRLGIGFAHNRRLNQENTNHNFPNHLFCKSRKTEKNLPDWDKVISHRIVLIRKEIEELKEFCRESINGSRRYLRYLKEKLAKLEQAKEELSK